MNTLDTLYFPDTVLPLRRQLPLALFFNTIHLLQPVEDGPAATPDEKEGQDLPAAPDSHLFTERRFCQEHTPSRLGVDRDRFLHLVHDIRTRKDSYVEQLSYLSLASLSAPATRGDQSKQTILSSLLHGMDKDADTRNEEERLALWQARLVLKIAEILDQEEDELARQLATIDDREIAMFRSLQGEIEESGEDDAAMEDPFKELLELRQKMNQPRPGMIKNRLRAWNRLYLSGPLPEHFRLWTTGRQEAADILLEQYEQKCGKAALSLLQLDLPAIFSENTDAISKVELFRSELQPHVQELVETLEKLVISDIKNDTDPACLVPEAQIWKEKWNSSLDSHFPASQYGRRQLTIFFLAEMPFSALIGETPGENLQPPIRHALLAVCA